MRVLERTTTLLTGLSLLTILVTGCGLFPKENTDADKHPERMFIDANLLFAMELPEPWLKAEHPSWPPSPEPNVTWLSSELEASGQPEVMVRVISQPPSEAKGGFARLKGDFLQARPDVEEISSRKRIANGLPALEMMGSLADRRIMAVFITTSKRAFTIVFSVTPAKFEVYLPLIEEILNSFHVLW